MKDLFIICQKFNGEELYYSPVRGGFVSNFTNTEVLNFNEVVSWMELVQTWWYLDIYIRRVVLHSEYRLDSVLEIPEQFCVVDRDFSPVRCLSFKISKEEDSSWWCFETVFKNLFKAMIFQKKDFWNLQTNYPGLDFCEVKEKNGKYKIGKSIL